MIESLKTVIQLAATGDRFLELMSGDQLEQLLVRTQSHYPLLADLGVIDPHGIQQAYYGSYDLQGTDYSDEKWFQEIFNEGVYVSDVYTGHRGVPHFAIAAGNYDPRTQSRWVLRPTIDAAALQQFTNTIKTNATHDLFLLDNQGKLQISSLYFGEILSRSQEAGDGLQVTIEDNGPGIAEEVLPNIFEPFYTTKETGKGTGLGLSITYGLIKKLGGDIAVQSRLGRGTVFTITIPLKNQNNEQRQ